MRKITTDEVAASTSPLSQAIEGEELIFVSGQVPKTSDGNIVKGGIYEQTSQCLKNISAILDAAGASMDDILKVQVFITDVDKFEGMNEAYSEHFSEPYPARSAFEIGDLAVDAFVEIEAIAQA